MSVYHDIAKQCYDSIVTRGWDIKWSSPNPVPDDAWPIDIIARYIRREVEAHRPLSPPTDLWRGECGHTWRKSEAEACPICALKSAPLARTDNSNTVGTP